MKLRTKIIQHKIKEIENSLNIIQDNLPDSFQEFKQLGLVKDGLYKKVEFCIENVIDILSIINSDLRNEIPSNEEDIIQDSEDKKIISKSLSNKLKEMKGLRNILVHKYGKIQDELAFENIKAGLDDFQDFINEIEKFANL
jgi:uncharacterized protein YutE (UPF0331/DUF86 family)